MTRSAARAAAIALVAALAAIIWLALFYGLRPDLVVGFDTEPPRQLTGLYPTERDPASGRPFAWTSEQVTLDLPGLDRRVEWTVHVRARGARLPPDPNPTLTFLVDGLVVASRDTTIDYGNLDVPIPTRADRRGMILTIRASPTIVPGPADPRALGVVLEQLRLTPAGTVVPPRGAFAGVALAAAAVSGAISLLGSTAGPAVVAALLISAGVSAIVAHGFAPYTDFPAIAARLGEAIGLVLVIAVALVSARTRAPLRRTARFVAAFSAAALLLKLLVLLHPDMPVGDALFQAHRFQDVLAGHLYFTSIAPGNYLFPYAPGLYVFAAPFAGFVTRGSPDMALLRIVTAAADAAVALLLYQAVVKARGDRTAAALAVAIYQLLPITFGVLSVGNLTNAFAQTVSVIALVMMTNASLRVERRALVALFTGVLAAAFLSHSSSFAILAVACFITALLFWRRGGPALRSPARALLAGLFIAVLLSVALYYAHFAETYSTELARIGAATANVAPDAGGRGITARMLDVPRYLYSSFGVPALALSAWGLHRLWRRGTDRLALSTAGWALACAGFLVLGVLTPIDLRHCLAAIPVVAVAAGFGASTGWSRGGWFRGVTVALLAWTLIDGVRVWWTTLGSPR